MERYFSISYTNKVQSKGQCVEAAVKKCTFNVDFLQVGSDILAIVVKKEMSSKRRMVVD